MNLTLFDLDGTLIPQDSDHAFGGFMVDIGWADGELWRRRNDEFYAQYQAGRLDLNEYIDFATSVWRSRPLGEALAARGYDTVPLSVPQFTDFIRRENAKWLDVVKRAGIKADS